MPCSCKNDMQCSAPVGSPSIKTCPRRPSSLNKYVATRGRHKHGAYNCECAAANSKQSFQGGQQTYHESTVQLSDAWVILQSVAAVRFSTRLKG
eukprot:1085455-Pelagomonas_calceolata.AAC.8